MLFGQRLQHVHARARKQRGDDLERWILGGGADQANVAFFDVREKRVLLSFVEAMNLVDEDDGARAEVAGFGRVCHYLFDLFDPAQYRGELDEVSFRDASNNLRERRFSHSGRTPKNDGAWVVAFDLQAQRLARSEQMFLADDFVERARTHAFRQRS